MKINDILDEWDKDSFTESTKIGEASLGIPRLHRKYLGMLVNEKMLQKQKQLKYDALLANKRHWVLGELSQDQLETLGWKPWLLVTPLRSQVDEVLKGDEDLIHSLLELEMINTKVYAIDNILKMIHNRSFQLNVAVNYLKFQAGE